MRTGLEPVNSTVTGWHDSRLHQRTKVLHLIGLEIIVTISVRDNATNPRCLINSDFLVESWSYRTGMGLQTTIVTL